MAAYGWESEKEQGVKEGRKEETRRDRNGGGWDGEVKIIGVFGGGGGDFLFWRGAVEGEDCDCEADHVCGAVG